jgi:hypothetical protein
LLRVDPERRFSTTPLKAGLVAVERVNFLPGINRPQTLHKIVEEIICGRRKAKREVLVSLYTM